jgi:hypothetical protein
MYDADDGDRSTATFRTWPYHLFQLNDSSAGVISGGKGVILHGITFQATVAGHSGSSSSSSMVSCSTSACDVTLLHCSLSCQPPQSPSPPSSSTAPAAPSGWSGVLLCDGSSGGIVACSIIGCSSGGIRVQRASAARISQSSVDCCRGSGVEAVDKARVRVDSCWIRGEVVTKTAAAMPAELGPLEGFGIYVGKESVVTVERVNIVSCRRAQVAVGDSSQATVGSSTLHKGGHAGVFVYRGGGIVLKSCCISRCRLSCIEGRDSGSSVQVESCTLRDGGWGGIVLSHGCSANVVGCTVTGLVKVGVSLSSGALGHLSQCVVSSCKGGGMLFDGAGKTVVLGCKVFDITAVAAATGSGVGSGAVAVASAGVAFEVRSCGVLIKSSTVIGCSTAVLWGEGGGGGLSKCSFKDCDIGLKCAQSSSSVAGSAAPAAASKDKPGSGIRKVSKLTCEGCSTGVSVDGGPVVAMHCCHVKGGNIGFSLQGGLGAKIIDCSASSCSSGVVKCYGGGDEAFDICGTKFVACSKHAVEYSGGHMLLTSCLMESCGSSESRAAVMLSCSGDVAGGSKNGGKDAFTVILKDCRIVKSRSDDSRCLSLNYLCRVIISKLSSVFFDAFSFFRGVGLLICSGCCADVVSGCIEGGKGTGVEVNSRGRANIEDCRLP